PTDRPSSQRQVEWRRVQSFGLLGFSCGDFNGRWEDLVYSEPLATVERKTSPTFQCDQGKVNVTFAPGRNADSGADVPVSRGTLETSELPLCQRVLLSGTLISAGATKFACPRAQLCRECVAVADRRVRNDSPGTASCRHRSPAIADHIAIFRYG